MTRVSLLSALLLVSACTPLENEFSICGEVLTDSSDPSAFAQTIANPGLPNVLAMSESGKTSVAVFQKGTCSPYLQLGDRDSDGVFDLLTYSALSEDGETLVNVEDYGMDGQPDLILNHAAATASVFYQGTWYPVSGVGGGTPSVSIDGQRRPLKEVLEEIGRVPF